MGTLKQDIKNQSDWIVKAFKADGLQLDYTVDSFHEIDRFFDLNTKNGKPKRGGRLSQNLGGVLFSIGSYIGETIRKNVPTTQWETDDHDPQGELTAAIKLPNGTMVWPMQRVMKRFQNGREDEIYTYGYFVVKDFVNGLEYKPFIKTENQSSKPWWKFW